MSAWPMWYSAGHQLPKASVKVRKARSTGTSMVIVPVSGGMVGGWSLVLLFGVVGAAWAALPKAVRASAQTRSR